MGADASSAQVSQSLLEMTTVLAPLLTSSPMLLPNRGLRYNPLGEPTGFYGNLMIIKGLIMDCPWSTYVHMSHWKFHMATWPDLAEALGVCRQLGPSGQRQLASGLCASARHGRFVG